MLFYFSLFFISYIFVLVEQVNMSRFSSGYIPLYKTRRSKPFVFLSIIFFLLSSLRWETGTDWVNYLELFNSVKIPFETLEEPTANTEPGFMFLNNLAKFVSEDYFVMLTLEAAILFGILSKCLPLYSPFPCLSLFVFLCMNLGGIFLVRQTLAIVILFVSLRYIYAKDLKKFIIIVLLATTIHRSSIVFLFAYPLFSLQLSLKELFKYSIIVFLLGSGFILSIFKIANDFNILGMAGRLYTYLEWGTDETGGSMVSPIMFMARGIVNRIFVVILVIFPLKRERENNQFFNGIFNLYVFGILLFCLLCPISIQLVRVTACFDFMQVLIYPYLFKKYKLSARKFLWVFLLPFFAYRFYAAISQFYGEYIPYTFIFEK